MTPNRYVSVAHSACLYSFVPKSLKVLPSVIGYIAKAVARIGQGESQAGIRAFDLTFLHCSLQEIPFLFLICVRVL